MKWIAGGVEEGLFVRDAFFLQYHSCAVTISGGVLCWGGNFYGQVMSFVLLGLMGLLLSVLQAYGVSFYSRSLATAPRPIGPRPCLYGRFFLPVLFGVMLAISEDGCRSAHFQSHTVLPMR